ncbi:MAG: sugar kinase, partial [Methylobacteriaceae bacterium]|nr:sugar kinase [Methylobacteriaceae bacterium]
TRLMTRLGDDEVGRTIVAELEAYGVDMSLSRRHAGCTSPVSAVLVDAAGERIIVNHVDPALPEAPGELPAIPADVRVALGDTRWAAGSAAMLARAKAAGLTAVLDGDLPGCPVDLLRSATLVAFSAGGLARTTGLDDLEAGLSRAATMTDAIVMATDGARGVFWLEGETLRHCPAFAVEAVDTLGAGDVFHGALAVALAEGAGLDAATRFASAAAAVKVTRFGGRAGAPVRSEVETLLARGPAHR